MISLIAAVAKNNGIGIENTLPWHCSRDLKLFKQKTLDEIVIMGRKTAESLGKPLKDRFNFVLSRNPHLVPKGFSIIRDIEEVKELAKLHSVYIIGGSEIYRQFIAMLPIELIFLISKLMLKMPTRFSLWMN
ncbi:dihydrofolate reductase [Providencia hangzhouensis]|uniref:dihydrofolate reductase n=1 Tax=Providencia hangzhouensis TaxID=3031799 RepID=UPI0034DDA16C